MPEAFPRRRRLELALVVIVAAAILMPGISTYSLVDPWETHYGEVARTMLANHDLVHTDWPGTSSGSLGDHEGFRSKPVLMFWMMAAGMRSVGVAADGGYSGEMTASPRLMAGIRWPFVASAIFGLAMVWWMFARLIGRRAAWLSLLTVGTTPMYCMIARNAIPDMPMVATTMGAIALFIMAMEDGDREIRRRTWTVGRRTVHYDARHIVLAIAGAAVVIQAIYYAIHFAHRPQLAVVGPMPPPAIWLPLIMLWALSGLHRDGWLLCLWRLPCVLLGGVIAAIVNEPMPRRHAGQSLWRHLCDDIVRPWERHAIDRYAIRALPLTLLVGVVVASRLTYVPLVFTLLGIAAALALGAIWTDAIVRRGWAATNEFADRLLAMAPLTTMRQLFLLGAYFLLAISLLAKGPPGVTVVALVGIAHTLCFWRWQAVWRGEYEIKRGVLLMFVVAMPWHIAMWLREGIRFVQEYWQTHILNRAGSGVDNSPGTFEYYTDQIGHGMWLWAALLPAAFIALVMRAERTTRAGRVRFTIALWAICAVALFCLVTTKFHHYILPAIPPLALVVALFLDDVLAGRDKLHPIFAVIAIAIVLLVTRDLMYEPERWIEMFVFRYDRPWPGAEPYAVDPSDPLLALGLAGAIAIAVVATRWRRIGVALVAASGVAICVWALQVYMPIAGTHWGMRDAMQVYYDQRTIYGEKIVYFGERQAAAAWADPPDVHRFQTVIPRTLQLGQPMTITVQVNRPSDERIVDHEIGLVGTVTAIADHAVEVTLVKDQLAKSLAPIFEKANTLESDEPTRARAVTQAEDELAKIDREANEASEAKRKELQPRLTEARRKFDEARRQLLDSQLSTRAPLRAVDADRLIAWQLYWRGEQFWSGGEIWAFSPSQAVPEMKTSFVNTNGVEFQKYMADRTRAPLGRRYFLVTEASRITSPRATLPTPRARDSYEVLDTTSNKFGLAAFWL